MHRTFVVSKLAADLLKVLTDVAQTPVSTLGKIFKIKLDPEKSCRDFTDKSVVDSLKSGAFDPTVGISPEVFVGVPPNVIEAIFFCFFVCQM